MTPTQKLIVPIVARNPGLTASAIAKMLGMDRNNIRKAALDLADAGGLRAEVNGQGYVFFPVNGGGYAASTQTYTAPLNTGAPIEGSWREVPTQSVEPASAGRELVPAGQPYDSRLQAALRQHAAAKARGRGYDGRGGHSISQGFAEALGNLHVADQFGDETLANLAGAINGAVQYAKQQDHRAEQSRELVVAEQPGAMDWARAGMFNLVRARTAEIEHRHQEARQSLPPPVQTVQRVQTVEPVQTAYDDQVDFPTPGDFDDTDLDLIGERAEELEEAEPSPPLARKGRATVNPAQAAQRLNFSQRRAQRRAAARLKPAEELIAERRPPADLDDAAGPPRSRKTIAELLAKPKSPKPVSWWERWFGAAKPAKWR